VGRLASNFLRNGQNQKIGQDRQGRQRWSTARPEADSLKVLGISLWRSGRQQKSRRRSPWSQCPPATNRLTGTRQVRIQHFFMTKLLTNITISTTTLPLIPLPLLDNTRSLRVNAINTSQTRKPPGVEITRLVWNDIRNAHRSTPPLTTG
jgi:hypothetical protein